MMDTERLTLKDLYEMMEYPWSTDHFLQNYPCILGSLCSEEIPEACNAIAFCVSHSIEGLEETDETHNINREIVKICRIGINALSEGIEPKNGMSNNVVKTSEKMQLYARLSACMFNLHRPFAAFHYLDCAENCYSYVSEQGGSHLALDIGYEHCRANEAEYYLRMVEEVPEKYRSLFSIAGSSYLNYAVENLIEMGSIESLEHYCGWLRTAEVYKRTYPISQQEIDALNRTTIGDGYPRWCQENMRYLNISNEVPNICTCDDVALDLDERHQWLLEDVMRTYDHCRKLLYKVVGVDQANVLAKIDGDDIESVVDCFVRLYTLLDKTARLITYLFPRDSSMEQSNFYDVAESLSNSPNPYLRSIWGICKDIFPDRNDDSNRIFDPRNNYLGVVLKRGFIRNNIIHGTLKIFDEKEEKGNYYNVASVTPSELIQCTGMMMYDVREIVLNLQLAVEFSRNHRSGLKVRKRGIRSPFVLSSQFGGFVQAVFFSIHLYGCCIEGHRKAVLFNRHSDRYVLVAVHDERLPVLDLLVNVGFFGSPFGTDPIRTCFDHSRIVTITIEWIRPRRCRVRTGIIVREFLDGNLEACCDPAEDFRLLVVYSICQGPNHSVSFDFHLHLHVDLGFVDLPVDFLVFDGGAFAELQIHRLVVFFVHVCVRYVSVCQGMRLAVFGLVTCQGLFSPECADGRGALGDQVIGVIRGLV